MSDSTATFQNIRDELTRCRDERDWGQFHNSKDLSIAIAAEAGELLELFLWKSSEEVSRNEEDPEEIEKISGELSDIFILTVLAFDRLQLDISTEVKRKIARNAENYPADVSRGSAAKRKKGVEQ